MAEVIQLGGSKYDQIDVDTSHWNTGKIRLEVSDYHNAAIVYITVDESKKLRKALKAAEKQTGLK